MARNQNLIALVLVIYIGAHATNLEVEAGYQLQSGICGTSTSSISWVDSDHTIHIRVYRSDGTTVTERCWDGNGWFSGAFSKPGTSSSAITWSENGNLHVRVYVANGGNIQEWCWDPNSCWTLGAFCSQGTSSSATIWTTPQLGIRVYVNNGSGSITERCWDGSGWYVGAYS